jgi:phosphate transport system protein
MRCSGRPRHLTAPTRATPTDVRQAFADELVLVEHRLQAALGHAPETLTLVAQQLDGHCDDSAAPVVQDAVQLRETGKAVDAELVVIAARQAPVAGDLRLVLALLQLAHHGMLIANQLGLIADQLAEIDPDVRDRAGTTAELLTMIDRAGAQLSEALTAFGARDLVRARGLEARDDAIDKINRRIFADTLALDATTAQRELAMRHVLISRSIERIGDNAVDIGEQTAFLVTRELQEFNDASHPRLVPRL